MGYKIFGNDIKDGQYFTMIGSADVFVYRGTGFKNLRDGNVTISKHKYHKFRPYFIQKGDKVHIEFTEGMTIDEGMVECVSVEYDTLSKNYKLIYQFEKIRGSWNLSYLGIKKIKIP